jgi:SWI/SNF-related matrix-associated actin-dependent regulator 1 of chromatin subfamily A
MGLGKTVQAIGVFNAETNGQSIPKEYSALVICPKSLVLNWKRELSEWRVRNSIKHSIKVCHYEALEKNGFTQAGIKWDLVVVDEAHFIKNPKTKRTQAVMALTENCKRLVLLTGTPILNSPIDLWPLLKLVCPEGWPNFWQFAKRYCNARQVSFVSSKGYQGKRWDISGASNLDELREKLYETCLIRRMKTDVMKQLPEKRRQIILLDNPGIEEQNIIPNIDVDNYTDTVKRLRAQKVAFEEISRVRHEQAIAKVSEVLKHVTMVLQNVNKVIIFAHHRDVIEALSRHLVFLGMVCVTGETETEDRQHAVDCFNDDPNCHVFLGSIHAAGTGLNLTAAEMVIFAESDWSPSVMNQAEDRAHRIGQKNSILVQILVWDKTLDARICQVLVKKQEVIGRTLG